MKRILAIIMVLCAYNASAQKPEEVLSIVKERKEFSWYQTQQTLWKQEIDSDEKNMNAWYNYYAATRALKNLSDWDSPQRKSYEELCVKIAEDSYKVNPNSFVANHLMSWQLEPGENSKYLLRAYEIDPSDTRSYDDLMIYYEIIGDEAKMREFAKKTYDANELPTTMLTWGYNLLSEVEENAIVFVAGDNDTYALWLVQAAKNYRRDVTVINYHLAFLDDYRKMLTTKLDIDEINIASYEHDWVHGMTKDFLSKKEDHPLYVSISAIGMITDDSILDDLYLTGLAYKYSQDDFDNLSVIRRNYEKRYLLDHLTEIFSVHVANKHAKGFEALYLPSMVKLYKLYQMGEEVEKMKQLEPFIIRISEESGQSTEISELLNEGDKDITTSNIVTTLLNVRKIEKKLIQLKGEVYMSKFETSNEEYAKFLSNLKRSDNEDLFHEFVYDSTQWSKKFNQNSDDPMEEYYHWIEAYSEYPVVNISHAAADAYCQWLTVQYNLQRKRNYKQVLFRLPTDAEWELAAKGTSNSDTGFSGGNIKNEKGCYLVNIQPEKGRFFDDGGFHTVRVDSYVANELGFQNMIGNVAEMTQTKNIARGGNWYTLPAESKVSSKLKFVGPDPGVGFRIVMEVIEE